MTGETTSCGARRPGWQQNPPLSAERLPCVRADRHAGAHRDVLGHTWVITTPELEYALMVMFTGERLTGLLEEGSQS